MYLGLSFKEGLTPYLEAFDHKGLYVFTIQAFGLLIGGGSQYGVFFIQVIFMSCNVFFLLEALKLFGYPILSQMLGPLFLALVYICFKSGNHTGELLLPWITVTLYFYLKALYTHNDNWFIVGNIFAGLEAAFAFGSRPSEAMWGVAFVLFYFFYWLKNKRDISLLWNFLSAFCSFLVPMLTYIIMAAMGGYLNAMYEAVMLQSLVYVGNHTDSSRYIFYLGSAAVSLVLAGFSLFVKKRFGREIWAFVLSLIFVTGVGNCLIARFPHYWISSFTLISLLFVIALIPLKPSPVWSKIIKVGASALGASSIIVSCLWVGL